MLLEAYTATHQRFNHDYFLQKFQTMYSAEEVKNIFMSNRLKRKDFKYILKFFKKNIKQRQYYLKKNPDENEIINLTRMINPKTHLVSDRIKTEVSSMLEGKIEIENRETFYANMIVDTNHPFFFEHPNEHVPGMMLIEAVRQLLVAISHKYGKVPLKDFNFVLSSMTGTFMSYLELNMPVLLKVVQTRLFTFDSGVWSDSDFRVHVFQNNKEAAVLTFQENILSSRVFKRLRSTNEKEGSRKWFVMKKNTEYKIALRAKGLKKIETEIEYISHEQCILVSTDSSLILMSEEKEIIEFFMYFSKIGFVHGNAVILAKTEFGNFSQIHLKFEEMDMIDKNNLHEAIKKYAYLVES
jgi:hypothetical protein